MKYFPWLVKRDNELAWLENFPKEIRRKSYLLNKGLSVKHWFPEEVEFTMAIDSGMRLSDALPNTLFLLVISEKLKEILLENTASKFEFLPIKIRNHKNRLVKANYYGSLWIPGS